jgi:protein TonB
MTGTHPAVPGTGDRLRGAIAAILVQALLGALLLGGLAVQGRMADTPAMRLLQFTLPPPLVRPEPEKKPAQRQRPKGAAAPPNLKSRATEVTSPVIGPLPLIPAAPKASTGSDAMSGNAPIAGPGAGAGGTGEGTGSGDAGDGDGAGDGGTALRLIEGRLEDSDYPRSAWRAGIAGTVHLRFTVGVDGRVTDCTVTISSGNDDLDETTCRLIQKRFRYRPSLDARGRPYADTVVGAHEWTIYRRPPAEN